MKQEQLKNLLDYDPNTGNFIWKIARNNNQIAAGTVAGRLTKKGYRHIGIDGKQYYAHRLAFLWMNGIEPTKQIDHINGIKDDNRWENLREATNLENHQNIGLCKNNTSGYNGVYYNKKANKWVSHIKSNNEYIYLGLFGTAELANEKRLEAQKELWKFQPEPRK